jgi:hypothetical protein
MRARQIYKSFCGYKIKEREQEKEGEKRGRAKATRRVAWIVSISRDTESVQFGVALYIYGLGEHSDMFRLDETNTT